MSSDVIAPRIFRLPRLAYGVVVLLLFCTIPLAFTSSGYAGPTPTYGPRLLFLLIPLLASAFIARTRTRVDADGVAVRAVFGTRRLSWDQIRGLSVGERSVYAVCADGSVRLPFVRVADLADVAKASGGRLPEVAEATPKYAPGRRPR